MENLSDHDMNLIDIFEDDFMPENEIETPRQEEINCEPMVGLQFSSEKDVYDFYSNNASKLGFGIAKRTRKIGDDGLLQNFALQCSRAGKGQSSTQNFKPRLSTKTNCQARIRATLQKSGQFVLSTVFLDYNHDLSPKKARYFRCNKNMDDHVKRRLELNDQDGIRVCKNFNTFVVEAGSYENLTFGEKDCRNYIGKARRHRLGTGDDGEAIRNYFTMMQASNSNFFYVMDLDDDSRLKNLFWADARSREAYKAFGDVISFDTTYLTNKYDMPFAPFVGVNHHGQSILLGCGLLSNETIDTFVWLFESWLSCMSGCPPKAIITYQCQAMKRAVELVFPNTRHRWCLWHIMKKIPEKLGKHPRYEGVKVTLQKVVYDSLTKIEFEEKWGKMIEKYELSKNEWLEGLYIERNRWIPVFVKDTFWAGMSTTQRSESMNAFFDGYVNSKTTLKQFVEQYDNALKKKQFQEAYTNQKFKEFQGEMMKLMYCRSHLVTKNGVISKYEVTEDIKAGDELKALVFSVYFNEEEFEVNCLCRLFEFRGIMCAHSLSVLTFRKVEMVPPKFILPRWRKDLKREYSFVTTNYNNIKSKPDMLRYDNMCKEFFEVGRIAAACEDKCNIVLDVVRELKVRLLNDSEVPMLNGSHKSDSIVVLNSANKVHSPIASRRRGRPPVKRKVSNVEKVIQKLNKKKTKQREAQEGEAVSFILSTRR